MVTSRQAARLLRMAQVQSTALRRPAVEAELARARIAAGEAQARVRELTAQLAGASTALDQAHDDATWLATWVANGYGRSGWSGYGGGARDVVDRYVTTGH